MTELLEQVSTPATAGKEKCVFCGKNHDEPKRDDVVSPGWERKQIKGIGSRHAAKKRGIYPGGQAPPVGYLSSGHHCIALSSFIDSKQNDRNLKLNYYLDKAGHDPNNLDNCIDLPREGTEKFSEFEKAVLADKPLQLHIGSHVKAYFIASHALVQNLYNAISHPDQCSEPEDDWLKKLKAAIEKLEDRAFSKSAAAKAPFILHPGPLMKAESEIRDKHAIGSIDYPELNLG